jgi:hypothetical protein
VIATVGITEPFPVDPFDVPLTEAGTHHPAIGADPFTDAQWQCSGNALILTGAVDQIAITWYLRRDG